MHHVVIVGGSYGGLRALKELSKHPHIRITLIDRHPYHFLQTEGYDLIAGKVPFYETIIGLRSLCAGLGDRISFKHAVAKSLDPDKNELICEDGEKIPYDYLVVAAGAVTRFLPSVEGLRSCSRGVKSLTGAFRLKQFFEEELYQRLESAENAKAHYSILVVGGGLSGVEIAAEMQAYFNRYYRSNALSCGKLKIHLVSGSLLKGLPGQVVEKSHRRLEKLGVLIHLGAHLKRVEHDRAWLEDGRDIPFDFMVFAGGIMAAPFVQELPFEKNGLGQIVVDDYLRAKDSENIFVIGDAADLRDRSGRTVPPTAQSAEQSGTQAGQNIIREFKGVQMRKADIRLRGLAIALGGHYAIIDTGYFHIYGVPAWLGKKVIEKSYKWPLRQIARKGAAKIGTCT
ncbi:NAD(P)/FAD-dependent oxidoreductase [Hydrogenimonas sp.]